MPTASNRKAARKADSASDTPKETATMAKDPTAGSDTKGKDTKGKDPTAGSAAPGTPDSTHQADGAGDAGGNKKPPHPSVGSDDPAVYPFPEPDIGDKDNPTWTSGAPADYDPKVHAPLKKRDFAKGWQFRQYQVEKAQAHLDDLIEKRDSEYALSQGGDTAEARRIATMAKKLAEAQQKAAAEGVDLSALLKNAGVDLEGLSALLNGKDD